MISKSVLIMGFGLAKARSRQAEALSLYPYTRFLLWAHSIYLQVEEYIWT